MSLTSQFLKVHHLIYHRTGGLIGHRWIGVPSLLLRTTGRKSGLVRTNSLVYARDGENYVVVPSNGGSDIAPAWLFNLRAEPNVEIQIGRKRQQGTASVVESTDADYPRLWKLVNDKNHNRYDRYQQNTERPIAVVIVRPVPA